MVSLVSVSRPRRAPSATAQRAGAAPESREREAATVAAAKTSNRVSMQAEDS